MFSHLVWQSLQCHSLGWGWGCRRLTKCRLAKSAALFASRMPCCFPHVSHVCVASCVQFANVMMQFLEHMERYMLTSGVCSSTQRGRDNATKQLGARQPPCWASDLFMCPVPTNAWNLKPPPMLCNH